MKFQCFSSSTKGSLGTFQLLVLIVWELKRAFRIQLFLPGHLQKDNIWELLLSSTMWVSGAQFRSRGWAIWSDSRTLECYLSGGPSGKWAPQAAGSSVKLTTYLTFVPSDLCPTKSSLFCFWNVANPLTSIYTFHYISLHYHHGLYHITWSRRLSGLYSKSILAPLRCVFLTEPLPVSVNGTPFGDRG